MGISKEFVLAGDAIFTVSCPDESHYTYRITESEPSPQYPKVCWFVKLLTGPDNLSSYTYLGLLNMENLTVKLTNRSKMTPDSYPIKLLHRILLQIWSGSLEYEKHGFKTHHEGRCGRCARLLTVPSSIESGIGPECAKRMSA